MKVGSISKQEGEVLMSYKIYGTLGFAIGGLIVGLAGDYMLFALIFMGLIGSVFLTIPARSLKLTILTAILGSMGFFLGSWVPFFITMSIFDIGVTGVGLLMGLIAGTMIGIAFRNVKIFILWGTIGFTIWGLLMTAFAPLMPFLVSTIACGVGGYFLGLAASKTMNNKQNILI
jgi:hypothetical protein